MTMAEKKTQDVLGREANMAMLQKERKANNAWNKLKRNRTEDFLSSAL